MTFACRWVCSDFEAIEKFDTARGNYAASKLAGMELHWDGFSASLFLLVFVVLPLVTTSLLLRRQVISSATIDYLEWNDMFLSWSMAAFFAVWFFFVGSSFASFLNVVAWRVPRGRSILGFSYCPSCNVRLTIRNNVPVVGWLRSGGRCTQCRLPISPRYLVVEVLLGWIFFVAAFSLLLSGGAILPFFRALPDMTLRRFLLEPDWQLISVLVLHLSSFAAIFGFALIEYDKNRIPVPVFKVAVGILVVIVLVSPASLLAPFYFPFAPASTPMSMLDTVSSLIVGGTVGWFSGVAVSKNVIANVGSNVLPSQCQFGLSVIGMIGGWQSAVIVVLLLLVSSVFVRPEDRKAPTSGICQGIIALPHTREY